MHSHSLRGSPSRRPCKSGGESGKNSPLDSPHPLPHSRTYEPKRQTTQQGKAERAPTLADIVRQETDNGRTIVRFYLDVASGKLDDDGFEVCHRLEAAEQVHAIAPGLVSEYIAQLTGVECSHAIRRRRTSPTIRRSREDGNPSPDADCASSARARHEALEYLASALASPSLADDPRVAGIVHESTDHGKTVVSFLLHVMHGVVRGFRPRQRVQAACELLGHIAHDELARSGSLPAEPALSPAEGSGLSPAEGSGLSPAEGPVLSPAEGPVLSSVEGPALSPAEEPALSSVESSSPRSRGPIPAPAKADLTVIPAEAGIQTAPEHGRQLADPGSAQPKPVPAEPVEGPHISTRNSKLETKNSPDPERGLYDIDRKIAEAQQDPSHPIQKFVQAYDEVAAAFHGKDKENDEDEEVRYWISGEVPDAYGKYIWEYAPAYPRSIRRRLRPKRRRRSREPGTTPKAESVWMKRPTDKMREAQPVQSLGLTPPRRPTGPSGANHQHNIIVVPACRGGFQTRPRPCVYARLAWAGRPPAPSPLAGEDGACPGPTEGIRGTPPNRAERGQPPAQHNRRSRL